MLKPYVPAPPNFAEMRNQSPDIAHNQMLDSMEINYAIAYNLGLIAAALLKGAELSESDVMTLSSTLGAGSFLEMPTVHRRTPPTPTPDTPSLKDESDSVKITKRQNVTEFEDKEATI